ncbi:multidrug efflux SMR transporter [Salinibacterium sp. ZJ77]|uniref:DMT family transporter n=1 Tax=Salinibacterium sp. ZJ77 TaxID=2708337 RepID=UPI001422CE9E|nr:multidrug efflux SMR transporter [Salinibacterium sp. ZJ77]
MPWIILLLSAVLEAVWATALGYSDGFQRPVPTIVFTVAVTLSMLGLGWAAKTLPIGTAYAVWTGVGAALTVSWALLVGDEQPSVWKLLFIALIVGAVIGLKLVPTKPGARDETPALVTRPD